MKINVEAPLDDILPTENIRESENVVVARVKLIESPHDRWIPAGVAARVIVLALKVEAAACTIQFVRTNLHNRSTEEIKAIFRIADRRADHIEGAAGVRPVTDADQALVAESQLLPSQKSGGFRNVQPQISLSEVKSVSHVRCDEAQRQCQSVCILHLQIG